MATIDAGSLCGPKLPCHHPSTHGPDGLGGGGIGGALS